MAFKWPWQKKTESEVTPAVEPQQQRDFVIPEKVFIERENGLPEYSFDEPARIKARVDALLDGFYAPQNYMELFYALPEIFAPVHEIASRVSDAVWQLKRDWNDEVDYKNATFNKLFSQPNPLLTCKQLIYQAVCYEILTGKQFFYKNKPDTLADEFDSILTLTNLPAHQVVADLNKQLDPYSATSINDFVREFRIPLSSNGTRRFPPEKILALCHLSLTAPHDINQCKSMLKGADKAVKNLIPVYEARGVIFIKRGALGFLVSKKSDETGLQPLTKSERDQLSQDADDTYGLTAGKKTIGITNVPVDFIRTAMSISELQPFDETLADAVAIYACLRVPRHLVPSKDRSTYANADADLKSFYSDVIIPWAKRMAEALTSFLKVDGIRRYIDVDFSHVDVLQENRKEKAEVDKTTGGTYQQAWLNGACSLNDWIVARGDSKMTGPLFEKKLPEMTPEELIQVKAFINLKSNGLQDPTSQDPGAQAQGQGGQLQ